MGGKYKAGVPELGLPALDPLVVQRQNIDLYIHLLWNVWNSWNSQMICFFILVSDARDWVELGEQ